MAKTIKLVFSGGDSGGKTTALNYSAKHLKELGFTVLIIEEFATHFLKAGLSPSLLKDTAAFENTIFKCQLYEETIIFEIADKLARQSEKNIIILIDRGLCGIKAFLNDDEFQLILQEHKLTMNDLLKRYDAVFHLVTTLDGAPEYYKKAHRIDWGREKILKNEEESKNAWLGHPQFKIFPNIKDGKKIDFKEKLKTVFRAVCMHI